MSRYVKSFYESKYVSFLIKNDKKYNKIWDEVCISNKKGFDSEPDYNEKYLKTKIKCYESKTNIKFHGNGIPTEVPLYSSISNIN